MGRIPKWSIFAGILIVLIEIAFIAWRLNITGIAHAQVVRFHSLFHLELAMSIGSFYIFSRFSSALTSLNDGRLRNLQRRWAQICLTDVMRAVLLLFLVLAQGSFAFYMIRLKSEVSTQAFICLVCLAGFIHLFVFTLLSDLLVSILYVPLKLGGQLPETSWCSFLADHRLKQIIFVTVITVFFMSIGLFRTLTPPTVVEESLRTNKLKSGSDFSIALLSDLHIGPSVGRSRVQTIVDTVNGAEPDLIAISGDLADGFVTDLADAARPLCNLKSKYGVYFATGNHEYYHGNVEEWFAFLESCNITILHNKNQRVQLASGGSLCVAGIDDLITLRLHLQGHGMNPRQALAGCQKSDFVLLLAHQPNAAKYVLTDPAVNGNVDLVLSGHTHNGQFIFFKPVVHLANAWVHGLYWNAPTNTHILVSAGVDYFGPPVRTSGHCEVVKLTVSGRA
ncbi:unnamed protein product, partial [Mesorhabditis belari]|uniref:Calcineurin-like phosphoesterase domain-containing protein n=1 Tax=Mesorhabditis belari TaxID=2138241 RepID=A0AAF3ERN7_9BILA